MPARHSTPRSVLVVDDDRAHRIMLRTLLSDWGWQVAEADDGDTAVAALAGRSFAVVLMDVRMARLDGMSALRQMHRHHPTLPVILMTAYSSVDAAVEAMKIGAHDYLTKPLDFGRLRATLEETGGPAPSGAALAGPGRGPADFGLVGASAAMHELAELLAVVAPSEATVLVTGESGTGKELVAHALHRHSLRKDGPLVTVNCAALAETLLESELFGHEKGAFTGADRRREGKFVQAHGGTLFLDEVGETSPFMQAKLLRALQEHEVQRVGGQETIRVDVRVVAATNRVLEEEVRQGRFREDLYYRLNVVTIPVPPLRARPDDIPPLAEHFVARFAARNRRKVRGIDPGAMDCLVRYGWPGNIRELENAMERAVILLRGEVLDVDSLPLAVRKAGTAAPLPAAATSSPPTSLEEAERQVILRTLAESGGNKSETARRLHITRRTLHAKLRKYGPGEPGADPGQGQG
ncbi:MAG: sigma-54 dependent transcriptional regulator [Thermodesulfobacteriota bacterium]